MILISIELEDLLDKIKQCISEEFSKYQSTSIIPIPNKPVNTKELCAYLGITPQTLIRWKKKRKIPYMNIGSAVRFDLSKVIAALEKK